MICVAGTNTTNLVPVAPQSQVIDPRRPGKPLTRPVERRHDPVARLARLE